MIVPAETIPVPHRRRGPGNPPPPTATGTVCAMSERDDEPSTDTSDTANTANTADTADTTDTTDPAGTGDATDRVDPAETTDKSGRHTARTAATRTQTARTDTNEPTANGAGDSDAARSTTEDGGPGATGPMAGQDWWAPRWKGQAGRLEVWYATATDAETGAAVWIHGEVVARTDAAKENPQVQGDANTRGDGPVVSHGWAALFPADGTPRWERTAVHEGATTAGAEDPHPGFHAEDLRIDDTGSAGSAGDISWNLSWDASGQRGLATFPRWAWNRELLPAAQVVPAPALEVSGTVVSEGTEHRIEGHGQVARIYGHGSAERWGWLHADLGDGDLIELVTAVSRRSGLSRLQPITFLRMRVGGMEWPATRIASWGLRTSLGLPVWSVTGRTQGFEVSIDVTQPHERCVTIDYTDPDGSTATCTNTEQADVVVELRTQGGTERRWELTGTAHAEVGRRP